MHDLFCSYNSRGDAIRRRGCVAGRPECSGSPLRFIQWTIGRVDHAPFGSRELVLAATLLAAPPEQVARVAALGAGIDGLDVVSSAVELARGRISTYTFVSGGCGAMVFTVLGLVAMRAAEPSE